LVVLGLAFWAMPSVNETPEDFPAATLYEFRVASLAIHASIWATIGLAFGALTERSLRAHAASPAAQPATV